ncbi:MAG: NAD(P)H-hydrate dehydratase [Clostridiales bacterium]|nr:NAD(P)H-hydrate dehydratase [Clostridiales bacterium]
MKSRIYENIEMAVFEREDLSLLPKRVQRSNKGTYGKLLVIAGSFGMAGAACLSARAAYRMGAGIVCVLTAEENRVIIQQQIPEAVLSVCGDRPDPAEIAAAVSWASAVVIGPGIGMDARARSIVHAALESISKKGCPAVIDADALNIIADEKISLRDIKSDIVCTPHLGEMSRLVSKDVDEIANDIGGVAKDFAEENDVICVLKDYRTVTVLPNGMSYLNLTGNPGMATAGSGDVLSGIVGSLLAQRVPVNLAAPLAVLVHGLAGDAAAERLGMRQMMAGDIIDSLSEIEEIRD